MPRTRFDRFELKYVISAAQRGRIASALRAQGCVADRHGDAEGRYPLVSLYYDNPALDVFWDRERGHPSRRKLRIRLYGGSHTQARPSAFLEIKHKYGGRVAKRRAATTVDEALALCAGGPVDPTTDEASAAVFAEARRMVSERGLAPSLLLRYERQAFRCDGEWPDLRVTFDESLACRQDDLVPRPDDDRFPLVLLPGWTIMEIKVERTVPRWLSQLVAEEGALRQAYSKYSHAVRVCHPELGEDPRVRLPEARRASARSRPRRRPIPADAPFQKVPAWSR